MTRLEKTFKWWNKNVYTSTNVYNIANSYHKNEVDRAADKIVQYIKNNKETIEQAIEAQGKAFITVQGQLYKVLPTDPLLSIPKKIDRIFDFED